MIFAPTHMPKGALVGIQGTGPEPKPYPDFEGDPGAVVAEAGRAVKPQDLHIAQLMLRTGKPPLHLGRGLEVGVHRADGRHLVIRWDDPAPRDRTYHLQRREQPGAWGEVGSVRAPQTRFVDDQIEPGKRYTWRVRAVPDGGEPGPWRETPPHENRPPPIQALHWTATDDGSAVHLAWSGTPETDGQIILERRDADAGDAAWSAVARLPIDATGYTDRAVRPAARYRYRVSIVNPSGQSAPADIDTFTRSRDIRVLTEAFTTTDSDPLPARSAGDDSLGLWQYTGTQRDRRPSLAPEQNSALIEADAPRNDEAKGVLAWPSTPRQQRSFVWVDGLALDLAAVGSQVDFDYLIGSSGISTHVVGLCLKIGDQWHIAGRGHTEQKMAWYRWSRVIHDLQWHAFDPQTISIGETATRPDLSRVTGIGVYIDRPINNRYILIDQFRIWAVPR